jgi:DNA-binding LytR/AlgR family response regulator
MKTRCLIIDDEPLAASVLENYIQKLKNVELVKICEDALEAVNLIHQNRIDLIFLDIQMPELSGLDFAKSLSNPPSIIFTTAYRNYAVEGFELNALDYLLKPFGFDRFLTAMNKYYKLRSLPQQEFNQLSTPEKTEQHIFVKENRKMVKIYLKDILFIESLSDYVKIHTKQRNIVTKQLLCYFEQELPSDQFYRIHRSYIISRPQIEAYSNQHVEIAGNSIPIGRNYKLRVQDFLPKV